jgi:hypothetical protein
MAANFKTLNDRCEYHLHEAQRIVMESGEFLDSGAAHDAVKFADPEKRKEHNYHISEYRVLWDRILKEFPGELAEYQAAEAAASRADLDAALEETKQSWSQTIAKNQRVLHTEDKKMLDEIRALQEKYPHEDQN